MYDEADLLPLSALQHLMFCERQCALIHIEQAWEENRLTAEGRVMHERAHDGGSESRGGVRIARGLRIRSLRLGLIGQADVVEFPKDGPPFPVEYKRGKPKAHRADEVQLCAQAMCLEEMLETPVPCGALFYGQTRRRTDVAFDDALRGLTENAAARLHRLIAGGKTPAPVYEKKKCTACSLKAVCLPEATSTVSRYLALAVKG
ncbi:MAG TPA: CRISPR-associated protein Cas4 [Kiritimatiellia bacterium]|nr:CRISPR-associated protein Cas4 [Kiritimatiellia bacterium]HMO98727.1 CRISPR-associated protein Cas4 [Kiritimatiellia bacterium]HMP96887.1 CRISPR-associated protein Cas4 [Kiritimatiellia bacterium]